MDEIAQAAESFFKPTTPTQPSPTQQPPYANYKTPKGTDTGTGASRALGDPNRISGRMSDSDLQPIRTQRGHRLQPAAADAFDRMAEAAARDGVQIRLTDSYRSYDQQVDVKKRKPTLAATPGKSIHGWGGATDIDVNNPKVKAWLEKNGSRFGWINPEWAKGQKYEPWHYEYVGGGKVQTPQAPPKNAAAGIVEPKKSGLTPRERVPELKERLIGLPKQIAALEAKKRELLSAKSVSEFKPITGIGDLTKPIVQRELGKAERGLEIDRLTKEIIAKRQEHTEVKRKLANAEPRTRQEINEALFVAEGKQYDPQGTAQFQFSKEAQLASAQRGEQIASEADRARAEIFNPAAKFTIDAANWIADQIVQGTANVVSKDAGYLDILGAGGIKSLVPRMWAKTKNAKTLLTNALRAKGVKNPEQVAAKIEAEVKRQTIIPKSEPTGVPGTVKKGEANLEPATSPANAETGKPITVRVNHGTPDGRFLPEFEPHKKGQYPGDREALPDNREFEKLHGQIRGGFKDSDEGIFFSDDPHVASSYSLAERAYDYQNSIPMTVQRDVRLENPLVVDMKGATWHGTKDIIKQAREAGHDGVIIKNVRDVYSTLEGKGKKYNKPANNVIVFKASQISQDAKGFTGPKVSTAPKPKAEVPSLHETDPDMELAIRAKPLEVAKRMGLEIDPVRKGDLVFGRDYQKGYRFFSADEQRFFRNEKEVGDWLREKITKPKAEVQEPVNTGGSTKLYHGSRDIDVEFNELRPSTTRLEYGPGSYVTADAKTAASYSGGRGGHVDADGNVYEVTATPKKPLNIHETYDLESLPQSAIRDALIAKTNRFKISHDRPGEYLVHDIMSEADKAVGKFDDAGSAEYLRVFSGYVRDLGFDSIKAGDAYNLLDVVAPAKMVRRSPRAKSPTPTGKVPQEGAQGAKTGTPEPPKATGAEKIASKLSLESDAEKAIALKAFKEADNNGVRSFADVRSDAKAIGISEKDIAGMEAGQRLSDAEYAALNDAASNVIKDMGALSDEIANMKAKGANPDTIAAKEAEYLQHDAVLNKITSLQIPERTRKGRELAYLRMAAERAHDPAFWHRQAERSLGFQPSERIRTAINTRLADIDRATANAVKRSKGQPFKLERKITDEQYAAAKEKFMSAFAPTEASALGVIKPLFDARVYESLFTMARYHIETVGIALKPLIARLRAETDGKVSDADLLVIARKAISEAKKDAGVKRALQDPEVIAAKGRLAQYMASLERTHALDTLAALWKAGLLTAIHKTDVLNIGGTASNQLAKAISSIPASIADIAMSTVTKTRTVVPTTTRDIQAGIIQAVRKGLGEAKDIITKGATKEELAKYDFPKELRSRFKIINTYVNGRFRTMAAEDQVQRSYAFGLALRQRARLQAINEIKQGALKKTDLQSRIKEIQANPTEPMVADALLDAEVATFNAANQLGTAISRGRGSLKSAGTGGRVLALVTEFGAPFTRTPINVVSEGLQYSAGLAEAIPRAAYQIVRKNFTPAEQKHFAEMFGKNVSGAGFVYLGYRLAEKRLATGNYKQGEYDKNKPPNRVKIGRNYYKSDILGPFGFALDLGADLYLNRKDGAMGAGKALLGTAMGRNPLGSGVTSGADLLRGYDSAEAKYGESWVPAILRELGLYLDQGTEREAKSIFQGFQRGLPIFRSRLKKK